MKNKKKIISLIAVVAIICCLGIGAYSYFTDYATETVEANAGTLNIALTDVTEDLTDGLSILNPGDSNPISFKVANTAEKSADIKAIVTVTGTPASTATTASPYMLYKDGAEATTVEKNGNVYTYTLPVQALIGSVEQDATLDGTIADYTFDYELYMDSAALNEWQDSTVGVKIEIFAKQHRNTTDAEWTSITTFEPVAD